MNTIKRAMPEIDTKIKNYSKYSNQMQFKGIVVDENIYDIDQQSSRDAKNVYVDDNLQLVSRQPLQPDEIPYDAVPQGNYKLVDIFDFNSGKIYISQNIDTGKYTLICIPAKYSYITNRVYYSLQSLTKYHLCTIEQYVICFNDVNAKLLNVDKFYTTNYNWEKLTDNCEIPTTKVVSKDGTVVYNKNEFIPNIYKEEYLWTNESQPSLPPNEYAEVILTNKNGKFNLGTINDANKLTEFRIATKLNYNDDLDDMFISAAKKTVCIASDEYVFVSYDNSKTFDKMYYPAYDGDFLNIAEVSKDGEYFFFVTTRGVYRCNLGTKQWSRVFKPPMTPISDSIFIDTTSTLAIGTILSTGTYLEYNSVINGTPIVTGMYLDNKVTITQLSTLTPNSDILEGSSIADGSVINSNTYYNTIRGDKNDRPYVSNYLSCFLSNDTFSFIMWEKEDSVNYKVRLYFKGHGLYAGDDYTDDHMKTDTLEDIDKYYTLSYIDTLNSRNDPNDTAYTTRLKTIIKNVAYYDYSYYRNLITMNTFTDINDRLVTGITIVIPKTSSDTTSTYMFVYGGEALYRYGTKMYGFSREVYQSNNNNITDIQLLKTEYNSNLPISTSVTITESSLNKIYNSQISVGCIPTAWRSINDSELEFLYNKNMPYCIDNYYLLAAARRFDIYTNTGEHFYSIDNIVDNSRNIIITDDVFYSVGVEVLQTDKVIEDANRYDIYAGSEIAAGSKILGYVNGIYYSGVNELQYSLIVTEPSYLTSGSLVKAGSNIITGIWTNYIGPEDLISFVYTFGTITNFTKIPNVSYSNTELYLGFDNLLQITSNSRDEEDATKILFNLPSINNKTFIENITGMINISTTEIALFFENKIRICTKVEDATFAISNKGFRYDYYNTKLSTGIRLGDSVINTLEGSYTVFPTLRGLAALNYQAFMATTDQVIDYITDEIKEVWIEFFEASNASGKQIRIIQWRNRLVLTNNTKTILLYDLKENAWWKWEIFDNALIALSDQIDLKIIKDQLLIFKDSERYYDMSEAGRDIPIEWYIMSQPLHFDTPNHYKNLRQLVFQFADHFKTNRPKTMNAQIKLYRKKITVREPECVNFKIEELRTFVKRFNYWKINEVQWALSNDPYTADPQPLELNGIDIKYEIGEEVR